MAKKRMKSMSKRITELVLVLFLVLFSFSLLLYLLGFLFPLGTSLKEFMVRDEFSSAVDRELQNLDSIEFDKNMERTVISAELTEMRNRVKARRAGAIAWRNANKGMTLYHRDAVQTLGRSSALIELDDKNYLDMGENTLVVIKSLDHDLIFEEMESVLIMVDGQLRGKIVGSDQKSVNVKIISPHAVTRVRSGETPEMETEFKITVNPDKSSTVSVFQGIAEVAAQGEVVRVLANQGVTVNLGQAPHKPKALPGEPIALTPDKGDLYYYRELPPRVRFAWKLADGVTASHFLLARDPDFKEVEVDEQIRDSVFLHGNLKEGEYFWRVSCLDGWREGSYSRVMRLRIVRDIDAPRLQVNFPGDRMVQRKDIVLRGVTEPGAHIFVQGKSVPVDTGGAFEHILAMKPGINVIVVEAVDAAGNVSYHSQRLIGR